MQFLFQQKLFLISDELDKTRIFVFSYHPLIIKLQFDLRRLDQSLLTWIDNFSNRSQGHRRDLIILNGDLISSGPSTTKRWVRVLYAAVQ